MVRELEKHILYTILNENKDLEVPSLDTFSLEFQRQYKMIQAMKIKGLEISPVNLYSYDIALNERSTIDYDFAEKSPNVDNKAIDNIIKARVAERNMEDKVGEVSRLLQLYVLGNQEAGQKAQRILPEIIHSKKKSNVIDISNYYKSELRHFDSIVNKEELDGIYLWGTGRQNTRQFLNLSYLLKRINRTDLVVIGARSQVGKTSFSLALLNALHKNGYKGMFISLEMPNEEIIRRMVSAKSGISDNKLSNPLHEFTHDEMALYKSAVTKVTNMGVKLVDNPPNSWLEIKQLIIEAKEEIDFVIIDHLHFISSFDGESNNNRNNMLGDITRDMKQFSLEHKIPIIALAQLNRSVREGTIKGMRPIPEYVEPHTTDLRDSGNIEQDADKILLLYREMPVEANTAALQQEMVRTHLKTGMMPIVCKVAKNRGGRGGYVNYIFNQNIGRWTEKREEWWTNGRVIISKCIGK